MAKLGLIWGGGGGGGGTVEVTLSRAGEGVSSGQLERSPRHVPMKTSGGFRSEIRHLAREFSS